MKIRKWFKDLISHPLKPHHEICVSYILFLPVQKLGPERFNNIVPNIPYLDLFLQVKRSKITNKQNHKILFDINFPYTTMTFAAKPPYKKE